MAPSAAQVKTVHNQWGATDKDAFTLDVYNQLFAAHPEYRAKFSRFSGDPNPADSAWKKQLDATRDALDKAITQADGDSAGLKHTLTELAKRHVNYGVGQPEFQNMKGVLNTVVSRKVSGADTAAWKAVTDFVCDSLVA